MTLSDALAGWGWRMLAAGTVFAMVMSFAGQSYADMGFQCQDTDKEELKCKIQPNGITKRENGVETKGHMVDWFYECIKSVCTNYMAGKSYPYNCNMDDLTCFCTAVHPECKSGWKQYY